MRFRDYALRRKNKASGTADIQCVDDLVWGIATILILWQIVPVVLDFLIYGG